MSAPHSYTNGHVSRTNDGLSGRAIVSSSESELSEAIDNPHAAPLPPYHNKGTPENGQISREHSISSQDEDAVGSEDADYEMESPPPVDIVTGHDTGSSSPDSPRPPKRKAGFDEDEHIFNNPTLYGIRRSVRQAEL